MKTHYPSSKITEAQYKGKSGIEDKLEGFFDQFGNRCDNIKNKPAFMFKSKESIQSFSMYIRATYGSFSPSEEQIEKGYYDWCKKTQQRPGIFFRDVNEDAIYIDPEAGKDEEDRTYH